MVGRSDIKERYIIDSSTNILEDIVFYQDGSINNIDSLINRRERKTDARKKSNSRSHLQTRLKSRLVYSVLLVRRVVSKKRQRSNLLGRIKR